MTTYTNRKFGIEVEFVGADPRLVARAIRMAGYDCEVEGYNHITRSHWKVTSDASLHSVNGYAAELVSPILSGERGVQELIGVLEALNSVDGVTVNRSCGLHVHLDAREMTMREISKTFERYAAFEDQIDMVMPSSRRGEARWCRSIKHSTERVVTAQTKDCGARALGRYHKVNLTNISSRGSVEFRQHSGTTEARKILNWLSFLMQFVERSIQLANATTIEAPVIRPRKSVAFDHARRIAAHYGAEMKWAGSSYVMSNGSRQMRLTPETLEMYYNGTHDSLDVDCWVRFLSENGFVGTAETDNGWLDGVCQSVVNYLNERMMELA
jgi:hypothetical protein